MALISPCYKRGDVRIKSKQINAPMVYFKGPTSMEKFTLTFFSFLLELIFNNLFAILVNVKII